MLALLKKMNWVQIVGLILGLTCATMLGISIYDQIVVEHQHPGLYAPDAGTQP